MRDTGAEEASFRDKLALAMAGMAIWHFVLGLASLGLFLLLLTVTVLSSDRTSGEGLGLALLAGVVVTGGAFAAAFLLGGISWALLGRAFLAPPWSVILLPGLIGTLVSGVASFIGWPTSELVGIFVAYRMVGGRLSHIKNIESGG